MDTYVYYNHPPTNHSNLRCLMSARTLVARPFSSVASRPLDWLWPGRLGKGKLSMLEGDPELGKSLVALDLCARLSTGETCPTARPDRSRAT